MTFLNPLFLIGLIAAAIPVILHLLNLRKLKIVEFSTLRFLKELQKTKIRRLKIKQIILLILRTLIIICIVIAFARPTVESSVPFLETTAKTSTVILIDNSFSMDVSDEYGNRLNQAKNVALSILKTSKEGDEFAIIPLSDPEGSSRREFSKDKNFINTEISEIKVGYVTPNIDEGLRIAAKLLEKSDNISKEVFVISDRQRNIFQHNQLDSQKLFQKNTGIFFIPIGISSKLEIQNLSVDSLNILTKIFQKGKLVELEGFIKNNSKKDYQGLVVSLFFENQRVAQRSLDINANQTKQFTISATAQSEGAIRAFVEIEGDALDVDNRRYFGFNIPDKPTVALVGSNPTLKYVELALRSKVEANAYAEIKIYSEDAFPSIDLSQYDIIICSEGLNRESDYKRLEQYVRNGGSAIFFADDKKNAELISSGLRLFGINIGNIINYEMSKPTSFSSVDKIHPIFEGVFKGTTDNKQVVESPKIYKAYLATGGQSIIEMPSGPFLIENRVGDGKILYFAVTPTTDWSSFPLTGLFPTLIYRSVNYLAFREGMGKEIIVGNPLNLSLPKRLGFSGSYKIITPDNIEYLQQAIIMPSGAILSFDNLKLLGTYMVKNNNDKVISLITVNLDPSESAQNYLSSEEIKEEMKNRIIPDAKFEVIEDTRNIQSSILKARTGSELWQLFVVLAISLAIAEMLVAKNAKRDTVELEK